MAKASKSTRAARLKRLLELVAKKHAPEYEPEAAGAALVELGFPKDADLFDIDLSYAYLRGLEFPQTAGKKGDSAGVPWVRASLDEARLGGVEELVARLRYSRLIDAKLPGNNALDESNLVKIEGQGVALPLLPPQGHRGSVRALAPLEGGWLASGGEGGTVRIWEVETGKLAFAALVLTGELAQVVVRLDKDGVTLCAPAGSRPWRARAVGEARLPADPLLHAAARFLYRSFALPLYRFPERFEWVGPEDEDKDEKTRCIRLKWPNVSGFEWQKQVF
ncbi:hypothetical protein [Oceanithermus sp.]